MNTLRMLDTLIPAIADHADLADHYADQIATDPLRAHAYRALTRRHAERLRRCQAAVTALVARAVSAELTGPGPEDAESPLYDEPLYNGRPYPHFDTFNERDA